VAGCPHNDDEECKGRKMPPLPGQSNLKNYSKISRCFLCNAILCSVCSETFCLAATTKHIMEGNNVILLLHWATRFLGSLKAKEPEPLQNAPLLLASPVSKQAANS
jgi:hypothetical protein